MKKTVDVKYNSNKVGERLRELRKKNKFSRDEIAKHIGRSAKYYADIERGSCGMSLETLMSLAEFYHVSMDYIAEGVKGPDPLDEETRWIVTRLGGLGQEQKRLVLEMVGLIAEQAGEDSDL